MLQGQCHEIFCFRFFFFMNHLPPQLMKIKVGSFQIFSNIHREICKTRCTTDMKTPMANTPQVSMTIAVISGTAGVVDTGGKYSFGVNGTGGKLPLASTTLSVNLPPVSLTPVAKNGNNISLLARIYLYVNSTTRRCPNKIIKTFLIKDFFHLPL